MLWSKKKKSKLDPQKPKFHDSQGLAKHLWSRYVKQRKNEMQLTWQVPKNFSIQFVWFSHYLNGAHNLYDLDELVREIYLLGTSKSLIHETSCRQWEHEFYLFNLRWGEALIAVLNTFHDEISNWANRSKIMQNPMSSPLTYRFLF